MSPVGPRRTAGVTAVGLATLLVGLGYEALGGALILAGDALMDPFRKGDPVGGMAFALGLTGALMGVAGAVFLAQGALGVLGGLGVVWRRAWGRVLTLILAGLAILWGLLAVAASDRGTPNVAVGAAQLLYGILAFVVLIRRGAEFSGQHTGTTARPGGGTAEAPRAPDRGGE